jgi:flagellar hook-basal body complex protein FliE
MNIIPITSGIQGLGAIQGLPAVGGGPNITPPGQSAPKGFAEYLQDAVENIENLDAAKTQDAYDLAIGNVDDLAALGINSQKYDLAVQLMVQMRNKLLDSYSEIMRMSI